MAVAVVGSIAFDSIRTPFGGADRELGGAGVHAAVTASKLTEARLVAAVGGDFTAEHEGWLAEQGIITKDLRRVSGGRTLSWTVEYDLDLALPRPSGLDLGVFADWQPRLSHEAAVSRVLLLGVMDPEHQLEVRRQWRGEGWAVLDTVRYWVESRRDVLIAALAAIDIALLTDVEARGLTREASLLEASRMIQSWGPSVVVIKRGEYGCSLLTPRGYYALPGYPLERVVDPTGARDAFAGGIIGYLDRQPGAELTEEVMRRAVTYGTVLASFCVEDFGARRTAVLTPHEVDHRLEAFRRSAHFEHVPTVETPLHGEEDRQHLEMPHRTPATRPIDAPPRTAGTQSVRSPSRPPSTEARPLARNPVREQR